MGARKGEDHWNAKLTDTETLTIRSLYQQGFSISWLAKYFDISESEVCRIVHRDRWKHL